MKNLNSIQRKFCFFLLGMIIISLSAALAVPSTCLQRINLSNGQFKLLCTGVYALDLRRQVFEGGGFLPYFNYAIEFFFMSFPIELFVNTIDFLGGNNPYLTIYATNILFGIFAVALLPIFYKLGISLKRVALFYVFTPLSIMYSLSFDYAQILLLTLSYYYFKSGREKTSSIFFGLSAGFKAFPIVFLPLFLKHTTKRLRFAMISIITFGTGITLEYLASPINFIRIFSFFSNYGVEGNWLGLVFPHSVINYGNFSTYFVQQASPTLHLPHTLTLVSLVLVFTAIGGLSLVKSLTLEDDLLLGFSMIYIFLWISAPQFGIDILALLPLVATVRLNWKTMIPFYGFVLFASNVWLFEFGFNAGVFTSLYIQAESQFFLALMLILNYGFRRTRT